MYHKPFNKELHRIYDPLAREVTKQIFSTDPRFTVEEHPNEYDVDLLLSYNGIFLCYLEVETKEDWAAGLYPWRTVHFLPRKAKYEKTVWVLFNKQYSIHLTKKVSEARTYPTVNTVTRESDGNVETFHDIPIEDCRYYGLDYMRDTFPHLFG